MKAKLRLEPEVLRVESFSAQAAPVELGTVHANDAFASGPSCRTACLTTPCCAPTVTCPA